MEAMICAGIQSLLYLDATKPLVRVPRSMTERKEVTDSKCPPKETPHVEVDGR
jgi:hypothetical protein